MVFQEDEEDEEDVDGSDDGSDMDNSDDQDITEGVMIVLYCIDFLKICY